MKGVYGDYNTNAFTFPGMPKFGNNFRCQALKLQVFLAMNLVTGERLLFYFITLEPRV